MKTTDSIINMDPTMPGAVEYDQALKALNTAPAITPGENDTGPYKTTAQPKDGLGGEASFK